MCGIVGSCYPDGRVPRRSEIEKMLQTINHRGPDDKGFYFDDNIFLGHRRLSIIDLDTGNQPMQYGDGNLTIVYNGEIYNFNDLKSQLIKKNYKFKTQSDTEVILAAYCEWGEDCVKKFNGEWSFAIWNKSNQSLFLSRDRYGIKPLYYSIFQQTFFFSSEIKTFSSIKNFDIDYEVLNETFVFGPKPGGKCFLKGVCELEPGYNLFITRGGNVSKRKYYSLYETLQFQDRQPDLGKIKELIIDSICKRLISDVPVGTLNSGGLDSSLISSIASKEFTRQLHTFNAAPEYYKSKKQRGDESEYAHIISDYIDSNHQVIRYNPEDVLSSVPEYSYYNDGLLFHSNTIPMGMMFDIIKNKFGIKVILSGEGADEVFRGYSVNKFASIFNNLPFPSLAEKFLSYKYGDLFQSINSEIELDIFARLAISKNAPINISRSQMLLNEQVNISEDRLNLLKRMETLPPVNRMIYYEQKCYLSGLLRRADSCSMRWGVETRVPFLDHRLVGELNRISFQSKSGMFESNIKKLLKLIAKDYLPNEIINRKKYGFSTSINDVPTNKLPKYLDNSKFTHSDHKLSGTEVFFLKNYISILESFGKRVT